MVRSASRSVVHPARATGLLLRLTTALAREARPDAVVRVAVDALVEELGAAVAGVFLVDEESQAIVPVYTVNYPPDVLARYHPLPLDQPTIARRALETGEVQAIASLRELPPELARSTEIAQELGETATVVVPLLAGGRRLGTLMYWLHERHDFDAAELDMLASVGTRVADALERARLEQAVARRADEAELLVDIASAAAGEKDLGRILERTLALLGRSVRISGGSIALVERDTLVVRAAAGPFAAAALGQRLDRGQGRAWQVIETGEPFHAADLATSEREPLFAASGLPAGSYLVVPLRWRGRAFGLLEVHSTRPDPFSSADQRIMRGVAAVLGGSVQLAQRYAEEVRLTTELESALAVRDQFLSIASHELRTPLTTIKAAAQLLLRIGAASAVDTERLRRQLRMIDGQVDRLRSLVDDLLDVGRIQNGRLELRREPMDLGNLIARVVAGWDEQPRKRLRLEVTSPVAGVWDPSRVEQVAVNLIENALKYSPLTKRVHVRVWQDQGDGLFQVTDHGIGIPRQNQAAIFDAFARASNASTLNYAGFGLGLFISHEIVARHGGSIAIDSDEGKGATFTVRLPQGSLPPEPPPPDGPPNPAPTVRRRRKPTPG